MSLSIGHLFRVPGLPAKNPRVVTPIEFLHISLFVVTKIEDHLKYNPESKKMVIFLMNMSIPVAINGRESYIEPRKLLVEVGHRGLGSGSGLGPLSKFLLHSQLQYMYW